MAGDSGVFQEAMNQGHSAAWDQLWERAASFYRQALVESPDHPKALVSLGLALIELQEFDEALKHYLKAARLSPEDPLPVEKLAQLYERTGNLERASEAAGHAAEIYLKNRDVSKAIENWERVVRLQPRNIKAHSRLAIVFGRLGEQDRAVREYLAVASLLQASGEAGKAVNAVNLALQISPESNEVQQALTLLRESKPLPQPERGRGATGPLRMSQVRQMQEPKDQAQREQGVDPIAQASQKALMALAGALFETADAETEDQAGRLNLKSIVTGTGPLRRPVDQQRVLLHLSQVIDLQAREEDVQAAEELQRAVDAGLENPGAAYDLGYLYARTGRVESAFRQLRQAINHPDYALGARLILGDLYRQKGQIKEASVEYLEALKLADLQTVPPGQGEELRQLYEPLVEAHRLQSDLKAQTYIVENIHDMLVRPDWEVKIQQARGQVSDSTGESSARPIAELLTEAGSSQLISALHRIRQLKTERRLRSAMEEAFFALEQASNYLPLHALIAELLVEQGEVDQAVEKYSMIARVYSMRGESSQAIALYRKIIELAPAHLKVRLSLVEELQASGQTDEAVSEYLQLAEVYISLADLAQARKTYADALRAAQMSRDSRDVRIEILSRIADIDVQSLDWRQALRIYEQIRTLKPEDQETRNRLVSLNYRLGQDSQAMSEVAEYLEFLEDKGDSAPALPFLEGLVAEHPDKTPIRWQLAEQYCRNGRAEEAIDQYDAIGDLLLNAGDREGAIKSVEMILSLEPPNQSDYQLLLEQLKAGKI